MALSAVNPGAFDQGDTANGTDVLAEINNILNNALTLISPLTGNLDVNAKQLVSMIPETVSSDPTGGTAGEFYYQSTLKTVVWWDGTNSVTGANLGSAQTFRNKTLTSPVLTTPEINDTSKDHQYVWAVKELTADRTITFPLLTGNVSFVFDTFAQTITNKIIDADNNTISNLEHGAEVDEPSSGVHGATGTIVGTTDTQTLSSKTLTAPVVNSTISGTAILDEDNMFSDSSTQVSTQQAIKAYVDAHRVNSHIILFNRTAAAGSGDQAVIGAGFVPSAVIVIAATTDTDKMSWGMSDDAVSEMALYTQANSVWYVTSHIVYMSDGTNGMTAVMKTHDADGFTVTWTKTSAGDDISCIAICLR